MSLSFHSKMSWEKVKRGNKGIFSCTFKWFSCDIKTSVQVKKKKRNKIWSEGTPVAGKKYSVTKNTNERALLVL